jgi:hypothetical protein
VVRTLRVSAAKAALFVLVEGKSLAGFALLTAGAALIYVPAGFITAGVLLLADRITD